MSIFAGKILDQPWLAPDRKRFSFGEFFLRLHNRFVHAAGKVKEAAAPPAHEIANFEKISDRLYCGGQPTTDGFRWLLREGVKNFITLRREKSGIFPWHGGHGCAKSNFR